jgi:hypothetical protein
LGNALARQASASAALASSAPAALEAKTAASQLQLLDRALRDAIAAYNSANIAAASGARPADTPPGSPSRRRHARPAGGQQRRRHDQDATLPPPNPHTAADFCNNRR